MKDTASSVRASQRGRSAQEIARRSGLEAGWLIDASSRLPNNPLRDRHPGPADHTKNHWALFLTA